MTSKIKSSSHVLSDKNPLVKYVVKIRDIKSFRDLEGLVMVEGSKMIEELSRICHPKLILTLDEGFYQADQVFQVSQAVMKKVSPTKSPEGVVALFQKPKKGSIQGLKKVVVFDRIQNPDNLGALIRSALAFGWQGAYILTGSSDPFNDKALRAARGATFHLPLIFGSEASFLKETSGWQLLGATLEGKEPSSIALKHPTALIIGNEGNGLSPLLAEKCLKITLPINEKIESLNAAVAGSILMYLLK